MKKVSELVLNKLGQIIELAGDLLLWLLWVDELHLLQRGDDVLGELLLDEGHRNLFLRLLGLLQDFDTVLVVDTDALQHAYGFVQWAVVIRIGESILLQELLLDDLGDLKCGFLTLIQGIFTYKLHDFDKFILFLEDLGDHVLVSHELGIPGIVVILQVGIVVRVRDVPVDGWEMLSLGELLIQSPEDLHDIKGG